MLSLVTPSGSSFGCLRVVLLGDDERRFDDAILNGLRERVVADCPWESTCRSGPSGVAEKSSQSASPCGSARWIGEQRLAPGEVLVVDVVSLVIEHDQVFERLHSFQH